MDTLIKAGKLFDLMIYPMQKHGISGPEATFTFIGRCWSFGRGTSDAELGGRDIDFQKKISAFCPEGMLEISR